MDTSAASRSRAPWQSGHAPTWASMAATLEPSSESPPRRPSVSGEGQRNMVEPRQRWGSSIDFRSVVLRPVHRPFHQESSTLLAEHPADPLAGGERGGGGEAGGLRCLA